MILDKLDMLSDAQALTGTANSTNVIDLLAAGRGLPDGEPMEAVITVDVAADATTGDETYAFDVVTSAATGLTTPTSLGARTIARAALTACSRHHIPLAKEVNMLRYLGIINTLGGTTPSVTITAHIQPVSMAGDGGKSYPSGFTVA